MGCNHILRRPARKADLDPLLKYRAFNTSVACAQAKQRCIVSFTCEARAARIIQRAYRRFVDDRKALELKQWLAARTIQTAYRGYIARKNYEILRSVTCCFCYPADRVQANRTPGCCVIIA